MWRFQVTTIVVLSSIFLLVCPIVVEAGLPRLPFLGKKKQYTPLIFFTTPPGVKPESDNLEKIVSEVERELGVRVERLDVMRDPANQALLNLLTTTQPAPFLYHRESCQRVAVPSGKAADNIKSTTPLVDKERVVAWAKGRRLPARREPLAATGSSSSAPAPVVVSQQEKDAENQDDLVEELNLSPLQQKGKQAIKERTEENSATAAEK